jgi:hypothetical protein
MPVTRSSPACGFKGRGSAPVGPSITYDDGEAISRFRGAQSPHGSFLGLRRNDAIHTPNSDLVSGLDEGLSAMDFCRASQALWLRWEFSRCLRSARLKPVLWPAWMDIFGLPNSRATRSETFSSCDRKYRGRSEIPTVVSCSCSQNFINAAIPRRPVVSWLLWTRVGLRTSRTYGGEIECSFISECVAAYVTNKLTASEPTAPGTFANALQIPASAMLGSLLERDQTCSAERIRSPSMSALSPLLEHERTYLGHRGIDAVDPNV